MGGQACAGLGWAGLRNAKGAGGEPPSITIRVSTRRGGKRAGGSTVLLGGINGGLLRESGWGCDLMGLGEGEGKATGGWEWKGGRGEGV